MWDNGNTLKDKRVFQQEVLQAIRQWEVCVAVGVLVYDQSTEVL